MEERLQRLAKRVSLIGMTLVLSLGVLVFSCSTPAVNGAPTELEKYQQELEEVSRKIELKQRQLDQASRQEKTVSSQLNVLEASIEKTEAEIEYLQKRLNLLNRQLDITGEELEKAEIALDDRTQVLSSRLKEIYMTGDLQYLEVLFDSSSLTDFLTRYDLLERILDQDMQLMREIEQQRLLVSTRQVELENQQMQIEQVKVDNQEKRKSLEEQSKEKEKALSSIQAQKDAYEKALDELEADSREIEKMIRSLQSKDKKPSQATGSYIRPLANYSRISSDYGMRTHPILKVKRMHTGIDYPAPKGTAIRASQSGEVIFAGWYGAYGQVVIIDHGGGISTMYAHQSTIKTSVGRRVDKGDTIGLVGSTGWSTGPHLHFEVRVNGSPVDPHKYVG